MKINFKMLWSIIGVVALVILGILAFQAIGFLTATGDDDARILHTAKLSNLNHAEGKMQTIYIMTISGILVAAAAVILPIVGFFFGAKPKVSAALGGVALFLEVAGAALLIVALSLFITSTGELVFNKEKTGDAGKFKNVKDGYDAGLVTAQYVLISLGLGVAAATTSLGFFKLEAKGKKKKK